MSNFDPSEHPRVPAGSSAGGQFGNSSGGASTMDFRKAHDLLTEALTAGGTRGQKKTIRDFLKSKGVTVADFMEGSFDPITEGDVIKLATRVGYGVSGAAVSHGPNLSTSTQLTRAQLTRAPRLRG